MKIILDREEYFDCLWFEHLSPSVAQIVTSRVIKMGGFIDDFIDAITISIHDEIEDIQ